jgi:rubrerythrin
MSLGTTRRELVRSGIGLAVAGWLVGGAAGADAAAPTLSEAQALAHALQIEQLSVIGYSQVLASGALSTAVRPQLEALLAQDRRHVTTLQRVFRRAGAPPPGGPADVVAAQAILSEHQVHRSLTDLPTQHDCLRVMIDIESLAEGAYFKAMPRLTDATLIRTSAEIMGSDAQHWTVLSGIQHNGNVTLSVPFPFVYGAAS